MPAQPDAADNTKREIARLLRDADGNIIYADRPEKFPRDDPAQGWRVFIGKPGEMQQLPVKKVEVFSDGGTTVIKFENGSTIYQPWMDTTPQELEEKKKLWAPRGPRPDETPEAYERHMRQNAKILADSIRNAKPNIDGKELTRLEREAKNPDFIRSLQIPETDSVIAALEDRRKAAMNIPNIPPPVIAPPFAPMAPAAPQRAPVLAQPAGPPVSPGQQPGQMTTPPLPDPQRAAPALDTNTQRSWLHGKQLDVKITRGDLPEQFRDAAERYKGMSQAQIMQDTTRRRAEDLETVDRIAKEPLNDPTAKMSGIYLGSAMHANAGITPEGKISFDKTTLEKSAVARSLEGQNLGQPDIAGLKKTVRDQLIARQDFNDYDLAAMRLMSREYHERCKPPQAGVEKNLAELTRSINNDMNRKVEYISTMLPPRPGAATPDYKTFMANLQQTKLDPQNPEAKTSTIWGAGDARVALGFTPEGKISFDTETLKNSPLAAKLEGRDLKALKPQEIRGFIEGEQSAGYKFNAYDLGVIKTVQQEYGQTLRAPDPGNQARRAEAHLAFGNSSTIILQELQKQAQNPAKPSGAERQGIETISGLECDVDLNGQFCKASGAPPPLPAPEHQPAPQPRQPEQVSRNNGSGMSFSV